MSRVYEMTAGAVIDAEGRTVANGVVAVYDAETGGNLVAPTSIRQADNTSWPIEGIKTDGNGKVKLLWPDSAGAEPAKLWVDTSRGRWPLEPSDLSQRLADLEVGGVPGGSAAELNERGDYAPSTAYAVADVFTYDGGRYAVSTAFTGGSVPDFTKTILLGAAGSAVPVVIDEDEDTDTANVAFLLPSGKYAPIYNGPRVSAPGGGGGGGGGASPWEDKVVSAWAAPQTTLTLTPTVGAANLVGQGDGGGAPRQENHAGLTVDGVANAMWRGTLRSFNATLGTSVPLESTLGYTTVTLVFRHVAFDGGATNCNLAQIGGDGAGLLFLATRNGGSGLNIRVLGNAEHIGAVTSPDLGTYTVPGGVTSMASFLNSGWHVLTLALKQGAAGKVVLDGTTIATGVDSNGFGPTTTLKLNALSTGDHQSGYAFKYAAVGTALTDSDITTMHADLAS